MSLQELLDLRDGGAWMFPRARGDVRDILADRIRLKATLADTVSALRAALLDSLSARDETERNLRGDLRWATLDLEHEKRNRPHWWERPAFVVPVSVLLTILAVDVALGG